MSSGCSRIYATRGAGVSAKTIASIPENPQKRTVEERIATGNIWKPEQFQGTGRKHGYFEGWYFKAVDRTEQAAFAIIPGLSLAPDPADSHAFVMLLDARQHRLYYARYPPESFVARNNPFELRIGGSLFSLSQLRLDMADGGVKVKAELAFDSAHPWPVRPLSPGVMGWYAFVPGMECYHGVLSITHGIDGYVDVGGDRISLAGGRGYTEKDWGRSMPTSWIWMQTNHFDGDDISLTGSVARIPLLGRAFTGYIFGLYLRGHLYRFTTYTGAKVSKIAVTDERIDLVLEDKAYRLEIGADRAEGVSLPAPRLGEMTARVNESLRSRIQVNLFKKETAGPELIFSGTGRNAGLEFVGDVQELLRGLRK